MIQLDKELSGRELDIAIAVKVMDWRRELSAWYKPNGNAAEVLQILRYSESIEAAMRVVEKLGEGPWSVVMSSADERTDKEWFVEFVGSSKDGRYLLTGDGEADTLPEAICRAALAAIGSKE